MAIHESGEDYLEQILIQQMQQGYARSIDIAVALNFSKPSVSIAMKTLRERGYITMDEGSQQFTATGAALMSGWPMPPRFMGTGYDKALRVQGDFGSILYEIKEETTI